MRLVAPAAAPFIEAGLNTLLYRPPTTTVATIDMAELTVLSLDARNSKTCEEHRPLLRFSAARIDQSKAERALATRSSTPISPWPSS